MIEYAFVLILVLVVFFIYKSTAKSELAYDPNKRFILNQPLYRPEASAMPSIPARLQARPRSASLIPTEIDYVSFEDANARHLYDKKKNQSGMTQADLALESTILSGN